MSLQKVTYGFIPTSITGCTLWLDAADASSVTLSGSTVTNVADKSGNGVVLSNATGFTYPNRSFNGSYPSFLCSSGGGGQANAGATLGYNSAFAQTTPFTVFFVSHQTQAGYGYIMDSQSGGNRQYTYNNTLSTPFGNSGTDITSSPSVVSMNWISGTSVLYLNGTSRYSGALGSFTTGGIIVGNRFSINESWPGHICELIYYSGQLGTTQQQQVESYLAQKWGLTSSLPATHPGLGATIYRADYTKTNIAKAIPYYTKFSPKSVPNCLIWFDAADSTTLGLTGTTVNTWTSKGSYTGNAAASTGTVVSGTVTQNGVNVVRFAAGTQLAFTMAVPNQARAWFSVTRCTTQLSQATNPSFWGIIDSPSSGAGEEAITGQVYGVPATNSYTVSLLQPGIADIVKTTTAADSYQIWTIISHVNSAVSTANNIITINGTSQTLAISSLASGYRTSSYTKIINKASLNSGMDVGEIIMYNGEITSTQRQQVESYLAQKWGLTASLPAGHLHLTQQAGAITTVALSKYRMVGLPRIIFTATGGTIVTSGFKYHLFTSSSNFVVSMDSKTVNYLVVGGGGGGGDRHGGGGGGGGVLTGTWTASVGTYTVTVGSGGQYGATAEGGQTVYGSPAGAGSKGGDSLLSGTGISITAYGGGGGGTYEANPTGTVGSGGGGGGNSFAGIAGTAGQGNAGGAGLQPAGGGGGGAGGVGADANTSTGGIGTTSFSTHLLAVGYGTTFAVPTAPNAVISGGVAYIAAGGGGAAASAPGPGGYGGLGGGGLGDWDASYILAGTANTGGGGGGSRSNDTSTTGRNGGSGLVLLWYAI